MRKTLVLITSLLLLSGCSLLFSSDPTFSHEKYEEFYNLGNYEGALQRIEDRIDKYPKDAFLHNEKGYILLETEDFDEALQSLDHAIKIGDKDVLDSAFNNKAVALNGLGRYEEAMDYAKKSIDLEPNEPEAFLNMGNALFSLERFDEALTYYDLALDIDPKQAFALYGKGASHYYLSENDQAIEALNQYTQLEPYDPDAFWYFAYIYDEEGDYEEAIHYLDKLHDIEKDDEFNILDYKGFLLTYLNRMEESLEIYTHLVESYPDEPYSHYGKGVVLINIGDIEKGLESIQTSFQLDSELPSLAMDDPLLQDVWDNDVFIDMTTIQ